MLNYLVLLITTRYINEVHSLTAKGLLIGAQCEFCYACNTNARILSWQVWLVEVSTRLSLRGLLASCAARLLTTTPPTDSTSSQNISLTSGRMWPHTRNKASSNVHTLVRQPFASPFICRRDGHDHR